MTEEPVLDADYDPEWTMDWGENRDVERHPDRYEVKFVPEMALAILLREEVCFLNSHWWKKEWSEADRKMISVNVNCSDVFLWGSADAETLPHDEIENLYRMWKKDGIWGAAVWCCMQNKLMPQRPVEKAIRAAGIWNLDEMDLRPNTTG